MNEELGAVGVVGEILGAVRVGGAAWMDGWVCGREVVRARAVPCRAVCLAWLARGGRSLGGKLEQDLDSSRHLPVRDGLLREEGCWDSWARDLVWSWRKMDCYPLRVMRRGRCEVIGKEILQIWIWYSSILATCLGNI
jgi:hypothetical protein